MATLQKGNAGTMYETNGKIRLLLGFQGGRNKGGKAGCVEFFGTRLFAEKGKVFLS